MERKNILEAAGYKVEEVWECEWNNIKKSIKNRKELEQQARDHFENNKTYLIVKCYSFGW